MKQMYTPKWQDDDGNTFLIPHKTALHEVSADCTVFALQNVPTLALFDFTFAGNYLIGIDEEYLHIEGYSGEHPILGTLLLISGPLYNEKEGEKANKSRTQD